MKVFSGSSNRPLAEEIAKKLNLKLSPLDIHVFPDGEKRIQIKERIVDEKVVLVQSTNPPVNLNYMELFLIADTIKRNGASFLTLVSPYLGYQRQDHVFREGEGVTFKTIVKLIEAVGIDQIITFDLHTIKIPEFFSAIGGSSSGRKIKVIHLSALPLFAEKIKEITRGPATRFPPASAPYASTASRNAKMRAVGSPSTRVTPNYTLEANKQDAVLVSPDMGGIRRIKVLSQILGGAPYAVIVKNRDLKTGKIELIEIQGNIKGKTAIIIDDMISTGETIAKATSLLLKNGAKSVVVFATHPVFSKDAANLLSKLPVEKIYVTDSIYLAPKDQFKNLEIISIADEIAKNL